MPHKEVVAAAVLNAYKRLSHDQLVLFLSLRQLDSTGTHFELAKRLADYDLQNYSIPAILPILHAESLSKSASTVSVSLAQDLQIARHLPIELLAVILDHVGDWELCKALSISTSARRPRDWNIATPLDYAVLSGRLFKVRTAQGILNKCSAIAAIRFEYLPIIQYLYHYKRPDFEREFGKRAQLIPSKASLFGKVSILDWWKATFSPRLIYDKEAIDGACRNGHVHVLEWWKKSGLRLDYTEASLEHASAMGHIPVLDWWRQSSLPLRLGRVMESASGSGRVDVLEWWYTSKLDFKYDKVALFNASCNGHVDVLDWWLQSGLQMIFDTDTLVGATKFNRVEVLEWWNRSKLPIQYKPVDIEEALEDALRAGPEARKWWRKKGVDFKTNNADWMQAQNLN